MRWTLARENHVAGTGTEFARIDNQRSDIGSGCGRILRIIAVALLNRLYEEMQLLEPLPLHEIDCWLPGAERAAYQLALPPLGRPSRQELANGCADCFHVPLAGAE
jgi:hypothetical protein